MGGAAVRSVPGGGALLCVCLAATGCCAPPICVEGQAEIPRELDKVMRDFDQSMRKLQNEDFLGKAKKDVVEREKNRLESLGVTKEKLERNLEVLR